MSDTWLVSVHEGEVLCLFEECEGPIELGRQEEAASERLFQIARRPGGGTRVVIARHDEVSVSRRAALVEPIAFDQLLIRNPSTSVPLSLEDGSQVLPRQVQVVLMPVVLRLGSRLIRIEWSGNRPSDSSVQSLDQPTIVHLADGFGYPMSRLDIHEIPAPDVPGILGWLRGMIRALQSAATDEDFFHKGAQAAVEIVRLDSGRVLVRDEGGWKTAAAFFDPQCRPMPESPPSQLVLGRVCREKKASWFDPLRIDHRPPSLDGVSSVVAAPVLDRAGEVIAVLYGERRTKSQTGMTPPVSKLDAMLLEVLAVGLSAGLARVEQERAAFALLGRFEQFFTPRLARQLATHPDLLARQDREITVLFGDIRGFSRITRKHGTAFPLEWTSDVLRSMSECVLDHGGVLVDYIGDELLAMWGAPEEQPDHALLACRAALQMLAAVPELDRRWRESLGAVTAIGIGINTGVACVGNIGTEYKFKYGPLGDTVNVASRVQGTCRYLDSPLVITRATRDRLGSEFLCRGLGRTRVLDLAEPIELFEVHSPTCEEAAGICARHDKALNAFQSGDLDGAIRILDALTRDHPDDSPSASLLARALFFQRAGRLDYDPVLTLTNK